jgi:hypothetical protein
LTGASSSFSINGMSTARDTSETIDWDMFKTPAAIEPQPRSLRGTGVDGLVRDDRLVAEQDNHLVIYPRRKRSRRG